MSTMARETKPPALVPRFEMVPDTLTIHHRWLVWRWELRPKKADRGKEWTKPPYNARTGGAGSSTDAETWSTFEEAVAAYDRGGWDGIGIALAPPLSGVDLDDVVDTETGKIHPEALQIVGEVKSYTEISPSGRRGGFSHTGSYRRAGGTRKSFTSPSRSTTRGAISPSRVRMCQARPSP